MSEQKKMSRRQALKLLGCGALSLAALNVTTSCNFKDAAKGGKLKPITYRKDNKLKDKISLLGFGCMRFPMMKNEEGKNVVNRTFAREMLTYAFNNGVNYFDTAYNYLGGESELVTGEILKDFPRDKFYLATKMPTWLVKDLESGKALFQEQLNKLQVTYLDFYLLHSLGSIKDFDDKYKNTGVLDYLNQERKDGRIKRLGFSFHGDEKTMDYLLEQNDWDFVQIQMNYLDWDAQNAEYMYNQIEKKGIQCIIMEPLRGGALATLNKEAVDILHAADPNRTPAEWAFRWVASHSNVLTILSGMTKVEFIEENINTFRNFKPLSENEMAVIADALEAYRKISPIPCTGCAYCMPCDFGVNIPLVFSTFNELVGEENVPNLNGPQDEAFEEKVKIFLARMGKEIPEENLPSKCTACGKCKKICPQEIDIPAQMRRINQLIRTLSRSRE